MRDLVNGWRREGMEHLYLKSDTALASLHRILYHLSQRYTVYTSGSTCCLDEQTEGTRSWRKPYILLSLIGSETHCSKRCCVLASQSGRWRYSPCAVAKVGSHIRFRYSWLSRTESVGWSRLTGWYSGFATCGQQERQRSLVGA